MVLRQPLIILEPPIMFVGVGVPLICSLVAALGPAIPLCPGSIAVLGLAIPVGRHLISTNCDLIA